MQSPITSPGPAMYSLLPHVFMCTVTDGAVFLDLRRDKYFGISAKDADALSGVVRGWVAAARSESAALVSEDDAKAVAEKLVDGGLLTREPTAGKEIESIPIPRAKNAFTAHTLDARPPIRFAHVVRFAVATARAASQLRYKPLEAVVARRRAKSAHRSRVHVASHGELRRLVSIFDRLRPFVFTSRNRCLFDSLVLLEYLDQYGVRPNWIFGVSTGPFAAHCWVQQGDLSLNCDVETTLEYVPILSA